MIIASNHVQCLTKLVLGKLPCSLNCSHLPYSPLFDKEQMTPWVILYVILRNKDGDENKKCLLDFLKCGSFFTQKYWPETLKWESNLNNNYKPLGFAEQEEWLSRIFLWRSLGSVGENKFSLAVLKHDGYSIIIQRAGDDIFLCVCFSCVVDWTQGLVYVEGMTWHLEGQWSTGFWRLKGNFFCSTSFFLFFPILKDIYKVALALSPKGKTELNSTDQ